ncbi:uncharacterized protein LOC123666374 [Melitaea cinxia]|uniref:uncharacterized protein LOC123666374 n=1 Tax=Melitaea cinxia TaxID=113334 RepID=UPI001E270AC1|nr:uncharacterized protein LOC123666374 [Melitaea cinxia]
MAPLVVEGETLGQKHRNYNKIVKETTMEVIPDINYEEPDLDNLLRIDIACRNRNIDYIIKVLQCEDMLYVSRAIKRSTWLITDPQYADIVNPKYLKEQLSPKMMTKAFNKLLLNIRLHLKDEKRVEEFFNYYEERDLQVAFKWLHHCSIHFTETIVQKHVQVIPTHIIIRLCEKSITFLDVYMRHSVSYYKRDVLAATVLLLNKNMDKYLDIVEASELFLDLLKTSRALILFFTFSLHSSEAFWNTVVQYAPTFGPKATKLIMRKCSERVMKNLEKYALHVHVPTIVKFIKREDIKDFITSNIKNKKLRSWFTYSNIKPFLSRLPIEDRFEFIKEAFVDNKQEDEPDDNVRYLCAMSSRNESSSKNVYRWYVYAPFKTAFVDLKKLIRTESKPNERTSMFGVMLTCAGKDMKNIHTLLKYYRENHINEPFKFKVQFVNMVISYTNTHRLDKESWGYLNDLFSSMDVYTESDKLDQNCVKSIILYNVIHDEPVPDIIENKFYFDTFKTSQKKLSAEEKEKLFSYLYKYLISKFDSIKINDKKELSDAVNVLKNLLNLLVDWNKELQDFPVILSKVKEIIHISLKNKWDEDVSIVYSIKDSWRKLLFAESIVLNPTQEACVNALKHGPELLRTYKNEVESLCLKYNKLIIRFLKKVRVYWSQSLANDYKNLFFNKLDQKMTYRASVVGLCTLLSKNDLSNLIHKYVPSEYKIDWSQPDDIELNLRKQIASSLHLARPQPSPAAVLLFAKGDYLQFVLPSLNAILYNMSSVQTREYLTPLLNAPVSLQKHGIRTAFAKLKRDELKKMFSDIWITNKNSSIRAAIFIQTLDFLCKQNEPSATREVWELLSVFIDNLTSEEDKSIYTRLSKVEKVPMSVRPEFWIKSYKFLKSLPPKTTGADLLGRLRSNMDDLMEFLDDDFVLELFMESFDENFSTKRYEYQYLVAEFLLSTKTEEAHVVRYNKVLVPILDRAFSMWNKAHEDTNYVRENLKGILSCLYSRFNNVVLEKKMILPIYMFTDILKRIHENLSVEENYVIVKTHKLSLDILKIMDKVLKRSEAAKTPLSESAKESDSDKFRALYAETAGELGKLCVKYLEEDVSNTFPSIYKLFAKTFDNIFDGFNFDRINKMNALKAFLEFKDFIPGYLFVLETLPKYLHEEDEKSLKSELLKDISAHPSKEIKMHYNLYLLGD